MSDNETPQDSNTTETPTRSNLMALLRLGNMQVLLTVSGEGAQKRPVARIMKIVDPEFLKKNPAANQIFELEDIAVLERLCKEAINHCIAAQTTVPMPAERSSDDEPEQKADK